MFIEEILFVIDRSILIILKFEYWNNFDYLVINFESQIIWFSYSNVGIMITKSLNNFI